jgi:hypothetical protein
MQQIGVCVNCPSADEMWAMIEALAIKRLFGKNVVNWIAGVWIATSFVLKIAIHVSSSKPEYYDLVNSASSVCVIGACVALFAHHSYDHVAANSASIIMLLALVDIYGAVRYAIAEVSTCSSLYSDQESIASVQKAYSDMIRTGSTQISVHALQQTLSTYDISPYRDYMCLGIAYGRGERIAHTFILGLACAVTALCGISLIWILERQSGGMKKAAEEIGKLFHGAVHGIKHGIAEIESEHHKKK